MLRSSCARFTDRYDQVSIIGFGTCSTVFKARDKEYCRLSAIKVFDVLDDYLRERELLSSLKSFSNIPQLYEMGDMWYSMQLLKKVSFHNRHIGEAATVDIGIGICNAVSKIHAAGYVHGDISPRNILFDVEGNAFLCDFSHSVKSGSDSLGLNAFSAPELKRSSIVSYRNDVYSLGLTLYCLIAGSFPFVSDDIPVFGEMERAMKMLSSGIPVPRPDNCSVELSEIILKAVEYDPCNRHQTIDELRNELIKARGII